MKELDNILKEDDVQDIVARLKAGEESHDEEGGEGVDGIMQHIKTLQTVLDALDQMADGDVEKTQDAFDAEKLIRDAIMKLQSFSDDMYKSKTKEEPATDEE